MPGYKDANELLKCLSAEMTNSRQIVSRLLTPQRHFCLYPFCIGRTVLLLKNIRN